MNAIVSRLAVPMWLILVLLLAGCSTTRAVWNARLGVFTFDQAVMELGPPDKAATLRDGTTVAEWVTRRGTPGGFTAPFYYYAPPYHFRHPYHLSPPLYYYDPPSPEYFLRLTFDPKGRLQAWQRSAR